DDSIVARLHHLVLALEHLDEVELEALHAHSVLRETVSGLLEIFRRLQQRLEGNPADIGAGAAKRRLSVGRLPVVDAGRFQPELRRADRGHITAWTTSD